MKYLHPVSSHMLSFRVGPGGGGVWEERCVPGRLRGRHWRGALPPCCWQRLSWRGGPDWRTLGLYEQ